MMPYQSLLVSKFKYNAVFGNAVNTAQETRGEVPQR